MKKMNLKRGFTLRDSKGFTLIELLVVVAIIGILASVVLASLNTARSKGADAAIKADLANSRVQAELYYDGLGANSYGTTASSTCPTTASSAATTASLWTDPTLSSAIVQAAAQAGSSNISCVGTGSPITTFAIAALLKTAGAGTYCVDSSGAGIVKVGGTLSGAITSGLCTQ